MTAAQRRMKAWSRMTSKQKLADMEKEDRRRKKMLRRPEWESNPRSPARPRLEEFSREMPSATQPSGITAAQPLYHEKP